MIIAQHLPKRSLVALTLLTASTLFLTTAVNAKQIETSTPHVAQPSSLNTQTLMAKKVKVKVKGGGTVVVIVRT
ncbi:hypothetical protein [Merismopedia glauca]|nr:hypothetical protein [Merismopedia glauca]